MVLRSKNNKELDIPLFVSEIVLPRYIAFKRKRQLYHEVLVNSKISEDTRELRDALLDLLPTLVDGDLSGLPFYAGGDIKDFVIDFSFKGELSLLSIYAHLINMIDFYKPEVTNDYAIEWFDIVNGEKVPTTFYIEPDRARRILFSKYYSIGEQIELEEFERKVNKSLEAKASKSGFDVKKAKATIKDKESTVESKIEALNGLELAGDKKGNLAFSLSTRQMTILMRPDGEKLPLGKTELNELIKRRIKVFGQITLDVYFNVRFFLLSILDESSPIQIINASTEISKNHFTVIEMQKKLTTKPLQ